MKNLRLGVLAIVMALLLPMVATAQMDVLCVYYPHWHRYAKGDEWFGADKWKHGEWCFVKDAKPRFAGHKQPLRPYGGFRDESNPKDMEIDIALAANAGINVFLYDYYFYDGKVTQEDALEKGFLGAANRNRMKFALMWCYHERRNQFRPDLAEGQKNRQILMSLAHTKKEFLDLIDLSIQRYFPRPEYYRRDGKLFFSVYAFNYFYNHHGASAKQVKSELDEARQRVRAAGLGEVHFNTMGLRPDQLQLAKDCGFDSVTDYNIGYGHLPWPERSAKQQAGILEVDYSEVEQAMYKRWDDMSKGPIPYIPQVTTGWDSTPRCRLEEPYPWKQQDYPYGNTIKNNTPDIFARIVANAKAHAERDPNQPNAIYINGWNEYTEGTYLVPNNFDSDGFLRGIAASFGRHPANEYTYIHAASGTLVTVPAATHEDVAYGPHPKHRLDVWLPKGAKGKTPLVMYIHGGSWTGGSMEDKIIGPQIQPLLDRGFAVICVGYRYLQEVPRVKGIPPVKGCIDDCVAALGFVKRRAAEWNIDPDCIGLTGGSAGACTALILAYTQNNFWGVKALAPVVPQTSLDPKETQEWIPNATYGAHAFGCRNFSDWLAHREEWKNWIDVYSPAALARKIDVKTAPIIVMRARKLKDGEIAKDPTHSPAFVWKFAEICQKRGLPMDVQESGNAIQALADKLVDSANVTTAQPQAAACDAMWARAMTTWNPQTGVVTGCDISKSLPPADTKDCIFPYKKERGFGPPGVADAPLICGTALAGLVDKWCVTREAQVAEEAAKVARGVLNLAILHGHAGFVCRGFCADGKSTGALSSRDQYTHWVHGLWRYVGSGMAKPELVKEYCVRIAEVARYMETRVTEARAWNFGLADTGAKDPRGICTMWGPEVWPHEAARLPMIYAAAHAATGDSHWRELYEKFIDPALERTLDIRKMTAQQIAGRMPCYSLYQANVSLEILAAYEKNASRLAKIREAMACFAHHASSRRELAQAKPGKTFYGMCWDGELLLTELMDASRNPDGKFAAFLNEAVFRQPAKRCDTCRSAHIMAAYWRARTRKVVP